MKPNILLYTISLLCLALLKVTHQKCSCVTLNVLNKNARFENYAPSKKLLRNFRTTSVSNVKDETAANDKLITMRMLQITTSLLKTIAQVLDQCLKYLL